MPFTLFPFSEYGKWGYMEKDGEVVVSPRFLAASEFSEHVGGVQSETEKYFIDQRGQRVLTFPIEWQSTTCLSDGLAAFCVNGKWGYCDKNGKVLIAPKFDDFRLFYEGLAAVNVGAKLEEYGMSKRLQGGVWGYIDRTGKYIAEPRLRDAYPFSEGLALTRDDHGYAYIDKTGKTVLRFESASWASNFSEGLACVAAPGSYPRPLGFIDKTGKFVIEPQFDSAYDFSEGLAAVERDRKYGYIDRSGRVVIEPRFHAAQSFSEGLGAVQMGTAWGFINKQGEFVIHPLRRDGRPGVINDVDWCPGGRTGVFYGGLARVHIGGEYRRPMDTRGWWEGGAWYYIDRQGKTVRRVCLDSEWHPRYGRV